MSVPAPRVGLREVLLLAWPMVLSRSNQAVVGLCDALMSARLGDEALAAVTLFLNAVVARLGTTVLAA